MDDRPGVERDLRQQLLRVESRLDRVEASLGFLRRTALWTLRTLAAVGLMVAGQVIERVLN